MSKCLDILYNEKPCYKIHIENSFEKFPIFLSEEIVKKYNKVCIVTDSCVANLHLNEFENSIKNSFETVISYIFPHGESSKNLDTVQNLYEELIINHFDRGDLLIALGGGVVGDMTGYAASTYLRGIDFIQVPTTLLSMVDSSIGGKTGVDFRAYKNMVGAFHMPKMVYTNLSTLSTLSEDLFSCGMGEILKHGLIRDFDYYNGLIANKDAILAGDLDLIEEMIYTSNRIKKEVVEEDPTEKGIRAHLNFGHTIGHAIEKLADFSLLHGQCVGIGMIAAAYLSQKLGYLTDSDIDIIIKTNEMYGLPISVKGMNANDILAVSKNDKKMVGTKVKFVILEEMGKAAIYKDFSDDDLLWAIKKVLV